LIGILIGNAHSATWFPEAASTHARSVDGLTFGIYVAAVFALFLFAGLALVFFAMFRRQDEDQRGRPGSRLNPVLLGLWLLGAVALGLFAYVGGIPGFVDQAVAPYDAYRIHGTARQGDWDFVYPNGHVADTLTVAVGRPVHMTLNSADVSHSLSIPALRVHQAVLPGRNTDAWFEATVPGQYRLQSNIFSGANHDSMTTAFIALEAQEYEKWLADVSDIFIGRTLPEVGELLYNRLGCKACHSLDGSKLVGPSFKDMYGFEFDTVEGVRITVDDAYVKESILTPNVSVIAGFQPVMTPYEGLVDDREIEAITAWLRTLSSKGGLDADAAADQGTDTEQDSGPEDAASGQEEN
jgi:cytochrome c oxidase subunit 2